ncbi:2-isopropylmalate synthase, partial [Leptospira borgpetersenii serovar Hardjo-bovis]|nr:2-isopropylmalate synthase [Leptospira borgpetersenii serovar Hardjo-bovis]
WAETEQLTERIEILGFVDGNKTVDWIKDSGARVLNLLTKGSLHHLEKQLNKTPKEFFADVSNVIEYAIKNGLKINVYLEDWSNGFRSSPDYVEALVKHLSKERIERIFLPDTLGVLSPEETFQGVDSLVQRYP